MHHEDPASQPPSAGTTAAMVDSAHLHFAAIRQFRTALESIATGISRIQAAMSGMTCELAPGAPEFEAVSAGEKTLNLSSTQVDEAVTAATHEAAAVVMSAEKCRSAAGQANIRIAEVRSAMDALAATLEHLGGLSGSASTALEQTVNTASDTHLLALNATVESARFGGKGAGFSVIADEINRLADQSRDAAQRIMPLVSGLRTHTECALDSLRACISRVDAAVQATAKTDAAFTEISAGIARMTRLLGDIRGALATQSRMRIHVQQAIDELTESLIRTSFLTRIALSDLEIHMSLLSNAQSLSELLSSTSLAMSLMIDEASGESGQGFPPLRIGLSSPVETLDPALAADSCSTEVCRLVFARLVECARPASFVPSLALAWEVNAGGTEYTFFLRKGAKFHDGHEISSADVKWSIERLLSPAIKSPLAWLGAYIDGAAEYAGGKTTEISGIGTPDPYVVVFRLCEPYEPFLANLAHVACSILPCNGNEKARGIGWEPVGSGAFRLKDAGGLARVTLEAFDWFFTGRPFLERVEITAVPDREARLELFCRGQLDLVRLPGEQSKSLTQVGGIRNDLLKVAVPATYFAGFNLAKPGPWQDVRFRKALNLAIDRERLIREILSGLGTPADSPLPWAFLDDAGPAPEEESLFDPLRGRALLDEIGWNPAGADPLTLTTLDTGHSLELAQFIAQGLIQMGVPVQIQALSWRQFYSPLSLAGCHLYLTGWSADTADPDNFLYPLFHSSARSSGNLGSYIDAGADRALTAARREGDPLRRRAMYREFCRFIRNQCPWIFLYHPLQALAIGSAVQGLRTNVMGMPVLDQVWLEKV